MGTDMADCQGLSLACEGSGLKSNKCYRKMSLLEVHLLVSLETFKAMKSFRLPYLRRYRSRFQPHGIGALSAKALLRFQAVLIGAFVVGWCLFRPLLTWPYRPRVELLACVARQRIREAPLGAPVEGLPKREGSQQRLGAGRVRFRLLGRVKGEFPEPEWERESPPQAESWWCHEVFPMFFSFRWQDLAQFTASINAVRRGGPTEHSIDKDR